MRKWFILLNSLGLLFLVSCSEPSLSDRIATDLIHYIESELSIDPAEEKIYLMMNPSNPCGSCHQLFTYLDFEHENTVIITSPVLDQYLRSESTVIIDEMGLIMDKISPSIVSGALLYREGKWIFHPLDPAKKQKFIDFLFENNR